MKLCLTLDTSNNKKLNECGIKLSSSNKTISTDGSKRRKTTQQLQDTRINKSPSPKRTRFIQCGEIFSRWEPIEESEPIVEETYSSNKETLLTPINTCTPIHDNINATNHLLHTEHITSNHIVNGDDNKLSVLICKYKLGTFKTLSSVYVSHEHNVPTDAPFNMHDRSDGVNAHHQHYHCRQHNVQREVNVAFYGLTKEALMHWVSITLAPLLHSGIMLNVYHVTCAIIELHTFYFSDNNNNNTNTSPSLLSSTIAMTHIPNFSNIIEIKTPPSSPKQQRSPISSPKLSFDSSNCNNNINNNKRTSAKSLKYNTNYCKFKSKEHNTEFVLASLLKNLNMDLTVILTTNETSSVLSSESFSPIVDGTMTSQTTPIPTPTPVQSPSLLSSFSHSMPSSLLSSSSPSSSSLSPHIQLPTLIKQLSSSTLNNIGGSDSDNNDNNDDYNNVSCYDDSSDDDDDDSVILDRDTNNTRSNQQRNNASHNLPPLPLHTLSLPMASSLNPNTCTLDNQNVSPRSRGKGTLLSAKLEEKYYSLFFCSYDKLMEHMLHLSTVINNSWHMLNSERDLPRSPFILDLDTSVNIPVKVIDE